MNRCVWAYIRLTPAFSAASIMSSHSSSDTANGTSTITCLPASAALTAGVRCDPDVTTSIASIPGSSSISSRSVNAFTPCFFATLAAASGSMSQTAMSSDFSIDACISA